MHFLSSLKAKRIISAASLAAVLSAGGLYATSIMTTSAIAQVTVEASTPSSFADLVEAVNPAVVSINVIGTQTRQNRRGRNFDFQFPDLPEDHPFRDFFDQFGDQFGEPGDSNQPREREFRASGSGFVISDDGYIVTNNHVVENADEVSVTFSDGREIVADIIGLDPRTDLALLKLTDASDLTYVQFAQEDVRVGDWVVAIGNPFGLGGSVTAGIVSARGRDITPNSYGDYIQIDAAVNSGNSGGPAFNLNGHVVGVNTAIFSPNGGNVGIAFAIPAATVEQVIDDLKDDGLVSRGFLGVGIQDVSQDLANSIGLSEATGAMVTSPAEGGPAQTAGIRSGDVITKIDGEIIDSALDLSRTVSRKDPGTEITVEVFRRGETLEFGVSLATLENRTAEVEAPVVEEEPEPPVQPSELGLLLMVNPEGNGLLVDSVVPDSVAAEKGLRAGDLITEVDSLEVNSIESFDAALQGVTDRGDDTAFVKVERSGNVAFVGLPLSQE